MSVIKQFFEHEMSQINHDIDGIRKAVQEKPTTGEQQLLDQLEMRKALVADIAKHDEDAILTELRARLMVAEANHRHDADAALSDTWWDSLDEVNVVSSLLNRLSKALKEDYVPKI